MFLLYHKVIFVGEIWILAGVLGDVKKISIFVNWSKWRGGCQSWTEGGYHSYDWQTQSRDWENFCYHQPAWQSVCLFLLKCQNDFSIQVTVLRKLFYWIDKFSTSILAIASEVWDYFMNFQLKSFKLID